MSASTHSVKNVIFDFGGVLLHWKPEQIVAGFYEDEALRARARDAIFQHPDWIEMDRGTLLESHAADRFAARMGRPRAEMEALLERVRESLTPIAGSIALLRDLHARGIPLYGLSNMAASTFAYLEKRLDHWGLFKGIVISADLRMIKPDAEIFKHISSAYGLVPGETVFIDDNAPNIEAAARLGFHTILFESPAQCAAALEVLLPRDRAHASGRHASA